ncbi:hypothetical protein J4Q44_G00300640 [Coregonus suidteri]|uniref:Uncharacterized protein n=1 Tax=Coregonus suidteri TaxID=861788 RepID=A0AAN8LAN7_9TELE
MSLQEGHEHPLKFLNLKRGEKLANAVFLLGDLKAMQGPNITTFLHYDFACQLKPHLQKVLKEETEAKEELMVLLNSIPGSTQLDVEVWTPSDKGDPHRRGRCSLPGRRDTWKLSQSNIESPWRKG